MPAAVAQSGEVMVDATDKVLPFQLWQHRQSGETVMIRCVSHGYAVTGTVVVFCDLGTKATHHLDIKDFLDGWLKQVY